MVGALGLLAGVPTFAQPVSADPRPPASSDQSRDRQPAGGSGFQQPEQRRKMLLEKYDADKDGKLSEAEHAAIGRDVESGKFGPPPMQLRRGAPAPMAGSESPGTGLDHRSEPLGPEGFGRPFNPGFGPQTRSGPQGHGLADGRREPFGPGLEPGQGGPLHPQFADRRKRLIRRYDGNNSGRLEETERRAIRGDFEGGNLRSPPPGQGRPGFDGNRPEPGRRFAPPFRNEEGDPAQPPPPRPLGDGAPGPRPPHAPDAPAAPSEPNANP